MTWLPLLLADPSPSLRLLVLQTFFPGNRYAAEIAELKKLQLEEPLVKQLLQFQNFDGSWGNSELLGLNVDVPLYTTAQALVRLAWLGFDKTFAPVAAAAEFIFTRQKKDGSWPFPKSAAREINPGYLSPLQTAFPLRALAACGYAEDPRAEQAYEWLLQLQAPDGSWPAKISARGDFAFELAGYRHMPNSRYGCRANTTGVISCFALHPQRRQSREIRRALDLLLARETRERRFLGFETARTIGFEPAQGYLTYYARFDLALILDFCCQLGAGPDDPRVADLVQYFRSVEGKYGLWEYQPAPAASRWVTFDILRSLTSLDRAGDWVGREPRTKYRSYPVMPKRY